MAAAAAATRPGASESAVAAEAEAQPAAGGKVALDTVEQRVWTAVCVDQKVALVDAQAC